jgi:hypothetical protein
MKTLEQDPRLPAWLNATLNRWPFCLDADSCRTLWTRCSDNEGLYAPGEQSLYMNGVWFVRLMRPFGVFVGVRPIVDGNVYQAGLGWKGNGRLALTLRRQSFEQSARGVLGPNAGHARGWDRGTA